MKNLRDIRTAGNLVSNSGSSSTAISFEDIKRAAAEMMARQPTGIPDVFVMTHDTAHQIRRREGGPAPLIPTLSPPGTWYGIPFESYPTLDEAKKRAGELFKAGKRVALICP